MLEKNFVGNIYSFESICVNGDIMRENKVIIVVIILLFEDMSYL